MAGNNGFENANNNQTDKVTDIGKESGQPNCWNTVDLCQGADKTVGMQATSKNVESQLPSLTLSGSDGKSASTMNATDIHDPSGKTADPKSDWSETNKKTDSIDRLDNNSVDFLEKTGWSVGGGDKNSDNSKSQIQGADRGGTGEGKGHTDGGHAGGKAPEQGPPPSQSTDSSSGSLTDLVSNGGTASQIYDAGGTASQVKDAGGTVDQVIQAGGNAELVKNAGGSEEQIKQAGGTTDSSTDTSKQVNDKSMNFVWAEPMQGDKGDASGLVKPPHHDFEKSSSDYKKDPDILY